MSAARGEQGSALISIIDPCGQAAPAHVSYIKSDALSFLRCPLIWRAPLEEDLSPDSSIANLDNLAAPSA